MGHLLSLTSAALFLTALGLTLVSDWRLMTGLLVLQYSGVMVLIGESWPWNLAVVKLVAGLMAAGILGLTLWSNRSAGTWFPSSGPAGHVFRVLAACLVGISVISFFDVAQRWFVGASRFQIQGGLFLIGLGLVHVALTAQPPRVVIGLLTVLSGFEILYSSVEGSILMTAFLGLLNLGLAFVGAYLLSLSAEEDFS